VNRNDRARGSGAHLAVAIVAPSLDILGGQAIQADRLLRAWEGDPQVRAWLVPVNPRPPGPLRRLASVKYLRTILTQLIYWPLLIRELRHADVVHIFSASYWSFLLAPLPAVLVARALGKPVVMNYRSGEAPDHLRRSALSRAVLKAVDRNVVPSRFLQGVFAGFGIDALVIPNIVDVDRFVFRLRKPLRPHLLSTRNFESLYNVGCTLKAFAVIQTRYPNARLTLVGAGREEGALRQLAADLNLRHVHFVGAVSPDDIWRYYADADIYLQTPDIDNAPSSVIEAFASGCAVVSTDAGGVPALVSNGVDGLLVPCGDHQRAAEQVGRLLDDPELAERITRRARENCDAFRWSTVRNRWDSLYRSVATASGALHVATRP
jgi:L-malate glycosyltransferase